MRNPDQGFDHFQERCIDTVGARDRSANGHFQHAGLVIEECELEDGSVLCREMTRWP